MKRSEPLPEIPHRFNAAAYFIDRHLAEGRGAKVAIECGDERVTYQQLFERVNRVGNALRQLGVRMEERVFLAIQDTPEFLYCFFGAIKIGAIPVPVNTYLKPPDFEYLLNDCRAQLAVINESLLPQFDAIPCESLRYLQQRVVIGHSEREPTLRSLMQAASPELAPEETTKDDVAFWLYSSGSTGPPKGCVHLQHDMVVTSELYAKNILGMTENDRCFSVAKLFFAYGLGNAGYFPLAVGATSILFPGQTNAVNVFQTIERHRPTLFFSVPSNFATLMEHQAESGRDFDLSSIRYAVSAGEALPAAIYHRFRERFAVEILDAIGSTEALHMFIANRPGAVRPGSSGQVIPGCEARIVDEHGHPVPPGEIGNLVISSDAVCAYYWNQHKKTKDVIHGHWIRTGDKYWQDEDGYYWYAGRADDMLKVSAVWVSPVEIENVMREHAAVLDAAAIGRNNADGLTKPMVFVSTRTGYEPSPQLADELRAFAAQRLSTYKRPEWIEFVDSLPKTATGKLQRFKLRERVDAAK
ncbi:MAG TPA: benzoate-CoA ligase family protein [Terriglobales bacterium]|nr:benzoate-CoA ligase family protein [Terriglobales bacterium]